MGTYNSHQPIYLQLVEQITRDIIAGRLPPGNKIPSVRDLAVDMEVNPNTMQRALGELERMALVFSQRTSGRFVTEDQGLISRLREELAHQEIQGLLAHLEALGFEKAEVLPLIEKHVKEMIS